MKTAIVNIGYGDFLSITDVANISVTVTDDKGNHIGQTVAPNTPSVNFDLDSGNYVVSAQAVDASGSNIGLAATASFTVEAPAMITVQIPVGVAVTFA